MGTFDPLDGKVAFESVDGRNFRFIRYIKPRTLHVWEVLKDNGMTCGGLDIADVNIETLKFLGVWDSLSEDLRKQVEGKKVQQVQEVHDKMAVARASRKKRYENMPKEVKCIQCGTMVNVSPSAILAKLEKLAKQGIAMNVPDFVNGFKCQKCHPTKGRRSTGKCVPIELACKCGARVTYPKNVVVAQAEKKGKTLEEFISGYECQKCHPTKGRPRK